MPFGGAGLRAALERLRGAVAARDRDPAALHIVPMGILPDPEKLAFYESLGVTEAVLRLPSGSREEVLPALDEFVRYLPAGP
jgi:hypothetical protein